MKIVAALWGADQPYLLGEVLRGQLRSAGATRLQGNVDDEHIPEGVLRMTRLMQSVSAMGADRDLDLVPTSRYVFEM